MKSGSMKSGRIIVIVRRTFFIESQCSDIFETCKRILGSISSIIFVLHIFSNKYDKRPSHGAQRGAQALTSEREIEEKGYVFCSEKKTWPTIKTKKS